MLNSTFLLLLMIATFQVTAHGTQTNENKDNLSGSKTPPGRIVLTFHDALKNKNVQEAQSFLSDDIVIFEGGGIERSAEEYASHHMLSDMKHLSTLSSTVVEHSVEQYSDIAISLLVSSNTEPSGKTYRSLETVILKKTGDAWRITHIHWSAAKSK